VARATLKIRVTRRAHRCEPGTSGPRINVEADRRAIPLHVRDLTVDFNLRPGRRVRRGRWIRGRRRRRSGRRCRSGWRRWIRIGWRSRRRRRQGRTELTQNDGIGADRERDGALGAAVRRSRQANRRRTLTGPRCDNHPRGIRRCRPRARVVRSDVDARLPTRRAECRVRSRQGILTRRRSLCDEGLLIVDDNPPLPRDGIAVLIDFVGDGPFALPRLPAGNVDPGARARGAPHTFA